MASEKDSACLRRWIFGRAETVGLPLAVVYFDMCLVEKIIALSDAFQRYPERALRSHAQNNLTRQGGVFFESVESHRGNQAWEIIQSKCSVQVS
jgi:hypothetical protein